MINQTTFERTNNLVLDLFTAREILDELDELAFSALGLTRRQELEHDALCEVVNELRDRSHTSQIGYLLH